ncbi:NADH-quinone oxidoreductase subunit N [Planctomicrobium sp. SH664]|uniref:NADH-quinone oxidoreductase subunit N n=1 Tax=Planctomicrobium sp. SH664 TaxID=3448125 RepID=UPI003F5B2436
MIDLINQAPGLIIPEIVLLLTVCVMFLTGPFLTDGTAENSVGLRHRWGTLALLSLGIALFTWYPTTAAEPGVGPFRVDQLTWFIRGVSLVSGVVLALMIWNQIDDVHSAEAHACLLAIVAGVNFVALANDLVTLFLGLELVSIPTYVLLYLPQRDRAMREATVKYFLLSIFSSAFVLFGMAWLFGVAGTTNLTAIATAASDKAFASDSLPIRVALACLIAGLGFRITAVPFHFYAPDVFQGVTSSAAGMLSFVPKVVGFAALLRIIPIADGAFHLSEWIPTTPVRGVLTVLALVTMFGGNLMALRQRNLHRLMAYSSVAHAGYMLVGLSIGSGSGFSGVSAMLFYLVSYGLMTVGVFALLAAAGSLSKPVQSDSELAGLGRTQPLIGLLLAVCLFSLMGLPPTVGMLGKLNLFFAAWSEGSELGRVLAICLAVNAAIAAFYYLRLVAVMYLDPPQSSEVQPLNVPAKIAGGVCAIATIVLFVSPQWLWDAAVTVLK